MRATRYYDDCFLRRSHNKRATRHYDDCFPRNSHNKRATRYYRLILSKVTQ